jgi:hypothetical protein
MRGDTVQNARAILARLALGLAAVSSLGLGIYGVGNIGTLSDAALATALKFASASGLATVTAAVACLAFVLAGYFAGSRSTRRTLVVAIAGGFAGVVVLFASMLIRSVTGGLSF